MTAMTSPSQILEDVSEEHARKTITVDPHPNNPAIRAASIHPCKHANVMKKLVGELAASGVEVSVEQYLVLFIKFIASIIPTIECAPTPTRFPCLPSPPVFGTSE